MRFLSLILTLAIVAFLGCNDLVSPTGPDGSPATSVGKKSAPSLMSTIDYVFVGNLGSVDGEGRLLVWDGSIHGDIDGQILWWFVAGGGPPNMPDAAHVGFYEARWEIWDGETLLLAGESGGSTALPQNKDGIWRGNGFVTEVGAGYEAWMDRPIKEGGNVNFAPPPSGSGFFRIN